MLEVGLRVVRGPDWTLRDEDGGEGYTGTLYHVNITNKTAIVQWDNGNQRMCRIGHMNMYELRILDNAQTGVIHENNYCDVCYSKRIRGPRYKCNTCSNYDLCKACYASEKHNLTHSFKKFETPNSVGIDLPPRVDLRRNSDRVHVGVTCDECSTVISGIRYNCNVCSDYDLCEVCYCENKHNMDHDFLRIDFPRSKGVKLLPRGNYLPSDNGIVHHGVCCDVCNTNNIPGTRYKCTDCHNYDLCKLCYFKNEHELDHRFRKIDIPNFLGIFLPPRIRRDDGNLHQRIRCDGCNVRYIRGKRYMCYNCINYDLCENCYNGNEHDLTHSFIRIDYPHSYGIPIPPRSSPEATRQQYTIHRGVKCDSCFIINICGPRYKCNYCYNYDLCESCYQKNKHDLKHSFKMFETPSSDGIELAPRLLFGKSESKAIVHRNISCDECTSAHIYGIRYKCTDCEDVDLCYICYHGNEHILTHSFTRIDTPQSIGVDLPPRSLSRKCRLRGIFKGAKVVKGIDWDWQNLDINEDIPGKVLDIRGWAGRDTWRSAANVMWHQGITQVCRLGYKGHCDIRFVEAAHGHCRYYYPEHLPILGQTDEQMHINNVVNPQENEENIQIEEAWDASDFEENAHNFELLSINDLVNSCEVLNTTPMNNPQANLCQATSSDLQIKRLQDKIDKMEQSQTCVICLEEKRNIVFSCGHGTCSTCCENLQLCHMCRKPIEMKIRIY